MNQIEIIKQALAETFRFTEQLDGTRVTTQCVYPTNGFVQVVVRGGADTFLVSDEGGALREIENAGATVSKPDKLLGPLVKQYGLAIVDGVIRSPRCDSASLGVAVAVVANASKMVAGWLFEHMKIKPNESFKEVVASFLRHDFHNAVRADVLVGHSNKPHKFDNIISLSGSKRLVIDPVINDRSSINARVVANMDLKAANYSGLEQRIVFDDRDDWKLEDLNLLQVGASVIPYTRAKEVISRLVHA